MQEANRAGHRCTRGCGLSWWCLWWGWRWSSLVCCCCVESSTLAAPATASRNTMVGRHSSLYSSLSPFSSPSHSMIYMRCSFVYIYITPIHLHENIIVSHNKVDHGIYIPVILTHSLTLFLSPLSSPSPLPLYFSLPSFFSLSLPPFIPYSAVKNRDGQKQWVQYS